jgi:hypothetical protein
MICARGKAKDLPPPRPGSGKKISSHLSFDQPIHLPQRDASAAAGQVNLLRGKMFCDRTGKGFEKKSPESLRGMKRLLTFAAAFEERHQKNDLNRGEQRSKSHGSGEKKSPKNLLFSEKAIPLQSRKKQRGKNVEISAPRERRKR